MTPVHRLFDKLRPHFEEGGKLHLLWFVFEAAETGALTTGARTSTKGPHIRDTLDVKRLMMTVVWALIPCVFMALWNTGRQANLAMESLGLTTTPTWRALVMDMVGYDSASLLSNMLHGALYFLPVYAVTLAVGGAWEVLFATVRKHEIYEGFLVTSLLFPLTMPPDVPLWQVAIGISFGVVIAKELFGGVGRNFLNPALAGRAYLYFAYPAQMSGGNAVWAGIDGATGATPMTALNSAGPGAHPDLVGVSFMDTFLGLETGSMGETSALACLIGAAFLIYTGIGSWRIMLSMTLGALAMGGLLNVLATPDSPAFWHLPAHWHLVIGSFAFGAVYMATDPVSASTTNLGRWIFGFFIGVITILVRVVNPAYPEGVMLAILLGNVFAPLFDFVAVQANIKRRRLRYGT